MSTIFGGFLAHAKKKEMSLTKDDFKFIQDILRTVPLNLHRSVLMDYCDDWNTGMAKTSEDIKKQNFGRKEANYKLMKKYGIKKAAYLH